MGQKLLAYGFLALVVIAAIILLKYQLDHKDIKQQQVNNHPNVVTQMDRETTTKISVEKSTDKKLTQNATSDTAELQLNTELSDNPLTYLDVYHQLQNAKACEPFFDQWQRDNIETDMTHIVRPTQKFYGMPDYLPNEKQPMTGGQNVLLKQWQQKCRILWDTYGTFDTRDKLNATVINDIPDAIKRHLLIISPKTTKEITLKNTQIITVQWQESFNNLEEVLVGDNSLPEEDIVVIEANLDQLRIHIGGLNARFTSDLSDDESRAIVEEINTNYAQKEELETLLKNQKVINEDALAQAVSNFQSYDQKLNQSLHSQYADVFFEALQAIEGWTKYNLTKLGFTYKRNSNADNYRITLDQMVLEHSEWQSPLLHSNDLRYATHLYLCDLGWDCGSDSAIMMYYCLRNLYTLPEACGLDVRTFYKEHLISPNRLPDVLTFKAILKDLYNE